MKPSLERERTNLTECSWNVCGSTFEKHSEVVWIIVWFILITQNRSEMYYLAGTTREAVHHEVD